MKKLGYVLAADTNAWDGKDEHCGNDPAVDGNYLLEFKGTKYCFHLFRYDPKPTRKLDQEAHTEKNDCYEKMYKWGFEKDKMRNYYQHLLDCYAKSGNDPAKQTLEPRYGPGAQPTCFYSLPVYKYVHLKHRECKKNNPAKDGDCYNFKMETL